MPIATRVVHVDPVQPEPAHIHLAAEIVRGGGLVAFPTETVYGLGANALQAQAVRGIFAAKDRPATDPLIVHLHEAAQLESVAASAPELARRLATAFWPGPLTLVVPRGAAIPLEVTAGREMVAVRVPSHPVAQALLAASAVPIAAPSANRFARPSPTTAQHVLDDLNGRIDLVLDAGPVPIGLESTIVDTTQSPPVVLRPGGLTLEALRRVAPEITLQERYLSEAMQAAAPGMFSKHYAPRAALHLFDGPRAAVLRSMRAAAESSLKDGRRVGILALEADLTAFEALPVERARLGLESDPEAAGQRLFAALRELDQRGVDVILARLPERHGLWLTIRDRLYRAAEGKVTAVSE